MGLFSSSRKSSTTLSTTNTSVQTATGSDGSLVTSAGSTINFSDADVVNNLVDANNELLTTVANNLFEFTDKTLNDVLGKNQAVLGDAISNVVAPDTETIKEIIKMFAIAAVVGVVGYAWVNSS